MLSGDIGDTILIPFFVVSFINEKEDKHMMQLDIQVKDGKATIGQSQISEEKAEELFEKWYDILPEE